MFEEKQSCILFDLFESTLSPIFYFKPAFCFSDGIFSPLDRLLKNNKGDSVKIFSKKNHSFFNWSLKDYDLTNWEVEKKNDVQNSLLKPSNLIYQFGEKFNQDLYLLERKRFPLLKKSAFFFEGELKDVWVHPSVEISRSACLDSTAGSIVIEKNVKISSFSHLKGPLFIGEGSVIDHANISRSRVGRYCKVGGEITHSLIGDYTNKSHEGFLGHSIVGDWVNLGAMTTTSNLKNNYGQVKLQYNKTIYESKTQKLGSIIGDLARTGIGTMLNTGTILDVGACLFEGRPLQKYYQAFFWGGKANKYKLDRFLSDLTIIMARREQALSKEYIRMIRDRYLI